MKREFILCGNDGDCCPSVIMTEDGVKLGEDNEWITLKNSEWNYLVDAVKTGDLGKA